MSVNKPTEKNNLPIGIFDSGMGGLTVLKELMQQLPKESFIYLGDTARLPYGTKSPETVRRYSEQMASILIQQNIKLLVVACNTASAAALPFLEEQFPELPILGVIKPSALLAVKTTRNKTIAVLATEATIASQVYQNTIRDLCEDANVITQSCSLFVALAEEGCIDDDIVKAAIKKYIQPIVDMPDPCDTVLLGCTHFPVLSKPIQRFLGPNIAIINSANATAAAVEALLNKLKLRNSTNNATARFLVTDLPERFIRIGKLFLEREINSSAVDLIDVSSENKTFVPELELSHPERSEGSPSEFFSGDPSLRSG